MTTWTPPRYPAGHQHAGKIIVDPEEELALAEAQATLDAMDAMSDPAPTPAPVPAAAPVSSRSLADLLPQPAAVERSTAVATTRERAIVGAGLAVLLLVGGWSLFSSSAPRRVAAPAVAPTAAPTVEPTPFATSAPSSTALPPDTLPRAIVGWFDYADPASAVPLERGVHYQLIARAGDRWLRIRTDAGAEVWALAEDLDRAVDRALPDLAPRPTARPAVAPAAAPAVAPVAPVCREVTIERQVVDEKGWPIGLVVAHGCSPEDAEANWQQLADAMRKEAP